MRSVSVFVLSLFAGILIATVSPSIARSQSATSTTDDLAKRADVVVVGKVTDLTSEWNRDRSRIVSRVTVTVDQHIKGDESQNSITLSTPGGEVDGVGEVYSHMPRFKMDEQVIVFAAKDQRGQFNVVGGDEGKLTITKDEMTGLTMVSDREPLSVFTSRIKRVVQGQGSKE